MDIKIITSLFVINFMIFPGTLSYEIRLALILDHEETDLVNIAYKAADDANEDLLNPIRFTPIKVIPGNTYDSSKVLCKLLQTGIGGVFGPTLRKSANHLMSICDTKEIPYIDVNYDINDRRTTINLYPHPKDIARALFDVIQAYHWQSFAFLYETSEHLQILHEITDLYGNEVPFIDIRRYGRPKNNYFSVLRGIRKSKINSILIVGSIESIEELLKQAQQVGIITEDYQFVIGNLDFHTLDLNLYQQSEANITALRLIDPQNEKVLELMEILGYEIDGEKRNVSCGVTTQMACLYDAVQVYAEMLQDIDINPRSLECSDDQQWETGFTINNYLLFASLKGITGNIKFDLGIRSEYSLEAIELTTSGIVKWGTWYSMTGLQNERKINPPTVDENDISFINRTFIVLTALSPPYGMYKVTSEKLSGNDQYEGFGIELIQRLADKLGFKYIFRIHGDSNYGEFNATTKQSSGMLKEVIEGNAHMAITDLTITSEREGGVDFSIPFMNLGIAILFRKPQKEPPKLFSFLDPFSDNVWLLLGASFISVSISFFILGRLSPSEWDNPYPCIEEPTELENQFKFGNVFWFSMGTVLQQGSEMAPKAASTRTIASIWAFFTIIMISSYTANLAAFLTVDSVSSQIDNIHDLAANKGGVKYGAKKHGATFKFFENSNDETHQKMKKYMDTHTELMTESNDEGVEKVLDDNYAFLMESTSIEYNVERKCNLTQVGSLIDSKGYGIAMPKDWPFRDKINYALLELQEGGVLLKMKDKWWKEVRAGGCARKKAQEQAQALGMPNLGGVFFVTYLGSILAAFYGIVKCIYYTAQRAKALKVSVKQELIEEFRFAINFKENTRQLKQIKEPEDSRKSSVAANSIGVGTNIEKEHSKLT